LAGDLTVQPDWTGAPAEGLTLAEPDDETRYRDASLVDLDGDGQDELLLSLWDGSWGGLEVWEGAGAAWRRSHRVGDGTAGIGQAFDHLIADLTGDDIPDVYACNDHGPDFGANRLLVNDGSGSLVDDTPPGAGLAMACMSVSAGDVDADGVLDLWLSGSLRTALLLARDDGYVDVASAWGAPALAEESMGWGTAVSDLDNDGLPDLVMARSGFSGAEDGSSQAEVLRQATPGVLTSDPWGVSPPGGSRNVAVLDLNGDGVLDLVWGMLDEAPRIYQSTGCTDAAWLEVVAPEGSAVRVTAGGRTWAALITGQPGFSTTTPIHAHMGLGDAESIDRVVLDVPWRGRAVLEGPVEPRQVLRWTPAD
ncbi:MAG: CRTAC1 family protein, partial [Myxococcota bacterium]|nr:CRTAC1 family protein [Myxococcota bacterium]